MLVTYPALFYYDDTDGAEATYFVHFPDFEFSATQGAGISEALAMGSEWLGITVADLIESDGELPQASDINSLSLIDNDPFKDDEDMLPYIGYFMFYIGHGHYLKDGINKMNIYADLYEDFIRKAAFIAKQSKEVVRKYRLLRLYLFAPKYYTTITYPIYKKLQNRWISTKKLINNLNDKLYIRKI